MNGVLINQMKRRVQSPIERVDDDTIRYELTPENARQQVELSLGQLSFLATQLGSFD